MNKYIQFRIAMYFTDTLYILYFHNKNSTLQFDLEYKIDEYCLKLFEY